MERIEEMYFIQQMLTFKMKVKIFGAAFGFYLVLAKAKSPIGEHCALVKGQ